MNTTEIYVSVTMILTGSLGYVFFNDKFCRGMSLFLALSGVGIMSQIK